LGKSFNAWHIAIPLLESHVIIFPDESRCFDALAELYKQVGGVGGACVGGGGRWKKVSASCAVLDCLDGWIYCLL